MKEQLDKISEEIINKNNEIILNKEKEIEELKNEIENYKKEKDKIENEINIINAENNVIRDDIISIGNYLNSGENINLKENEDDNLLSELLNQLIKAKNIISFLLPTK